MATKKKALQAAAGAAGGEAVYIDDIFATYLYTGNGSTQTITNGIDLDGEGGLVWIKARDGGAQWSRLYDTERGGQYSLVSSDTTAQLTGTGPITFNSDSFVIGSNNPANVNSLDRSYASWTFRKAPKFFDVVTYTGDGASTRTISHSLGSTPGCIIAKSSSLSGGAYGSWTVYHRGAGTGSLFLNTTGTYAPANSAWQNTAPTSTEFYVDPNLNQNGATYVAYLFAHNDGDGEFGETGDQDIIKCGSYTGNGSSSARNIELGFEPQWLLIKRSSLAEDWHLMDVMRGMPAGVGGSETAVLEPNDSAAEITPVDLYPYANGFTIDDSNAGVNTSGETYIYIAIRRPMKTPESVTEVFAVDDRTGASGNLGAYRSGFPVDMAFHKVITSALNPYEIGSRLTQGRRLNTTSTDAETASADQQYDYMDGWSTETSSNTTKYSWMFRRAPGFFDVVCYTGDGTAGRTVDHNLGVAPEMIWVKCRSQVESWHVYHSGLNSGTTPEDFYLTLETANAEVNAVQPWNDTAPTDTVFTLGTKTDVNGSGLNFIAYLFASLPGVSKVGSYTGNGTSQTIDCGFSTGARFVLIKNATTTSDWSIFDTERGIVAGNDPWLKLNNTDAEVTLYDMIDPDSTGFHIPNGFTSLNSSGDTFIYLAIA